METLNVGRKETEGRPTCVKTGTLLACGMDKTFPFCVEYGTPSMCEGWNMAPPLSNSEGMDATLRAWSLQGYWSFCENYKMVLLPLGNEVLYQSTQSVVLPPPCTHLPFAYCTECSMLCSSHTEGVLEKKTHFHPTDLQVFWDFSRLCSDAENTELHIFI